VRTRPTGVQTPRPAYAYDKLTPSDLDRALAEAEAEVERADLRRNPLATDAEGVTCAKCTCPWGHIVAAQQLCDLHAQDARLNQRVAWQKEEQAAMRARQ
jgi:hypothetical protein